MQCNGLYSYMPVRQIPKNYRNVTGLASAKKSNRVLFESTLERDFFTILEFDTNVRNFDTQPVKIYWVDPLGKSRSYHPDALVNYYPSKGIFRSTETVLFEVKYRSDIKENWAEYKPKFKAAIRYAKKMGWRFKLITECEIRTNYMENARFLLPYLNHSLDESHERLLLERLLILRESSVEALIASIFNDKWNQAELIPSVWHLIGSRRVATDLNLPLTMSSRIWLENY